MDVTELGSLCLRLLLPTLFGGAIGWERESLDKPAGLRTHMLVGLGASCFTLVGLELFRDLSTNTSNNLDPIRVVEGVAGGIGFLGAGSIIKAGKDPRGLTTAAGIWAVGGVGAACGSGYFWIAGVTSAITLFVLLVGRLHRLPGKD
ncbi:MAG: MgtC/SapB family protein [Bryobacterales bacterium]